VVLAPVLDQILTKALSSPLRKMYDFMTEVEIFILEKKTVTEKNESQKI